MTEFEKMLTGEWYDAGDPELDKLRNRCRTLCARYNALPPEDKPSQTAALRELLGQVGDDAIVVAPIHFDYGKNTAVGRGFLSNANCIFLDCAKITFGDHVLVGPGCGFFTAAHPIDAAARRTGMEYAKPITVGSDVWFGGNVTVLPGVTIGDGSVIGAGSVVTKDIPSGVIAVGNPCRVLRSITEADREILP